MRGRIVSINLLLLVGVLLLAWQLRSGWKTFEQTYSPRKTVEAAQAEPVLLTLPDVLGVEEPRTLPTFLVVSERNLFSEDRRSTSEETSQALTQEKPPAWPARPTLHGVSSVGGQKRAVVTTYEKPNQGKLRTVQVGDAVQGFEVAAIQETTMRLQWKDREEIIDMADAPPPKTAAARKGAKASVTVITVGSSKSAATRKTAAARGGRTGRRGLDVAVVQGRANQRAGGTQANQQQNQSGNLPAASSQGRGSPATARPTQPSRR